jgi:hypothetical protein
MSSFQQCSHYITSSTYQDVLDLTTHTEIFRMLCRALANISNTCPTLLKECFGPDDVAQMKSLHLQEMRDFLLRISKNRVSAKELESCSEGRNDPFHIQMGQESSTKRSGHSGGSSSSSVKNTIDLSTSGDTTTQASKSTSTSYKSAAIEAITPRGSEVTHASDTQRSAADYVRSTKGTTTQKPTTRQPAAVLTEQLAPHPQQDYEDYYDDSEEEARDQKKEVSSLDENHGKDRPANMGSPHNSQLYPLKEAATIRGDDESRWEGRGRGEASTLTGGEGHRDSSSLLMISLTMMLSCLYRLMM